MSKAQFDKAVAIVQGLPKGGPVQTSTDDKLFFYKYFKQATVGNVDTPRPGMMDFTGKAKWDAWKSVENVSTEEAMKKYVEKLLEVLKASGTPEADGYIKEIEEAA